VSFQPQHSHLCFHWGDIHQHSLSVGNLRAFPPQPGQTPSSTVIEPPHLVEEMPTISWNIVYFLRAICVFSLWIHLCSNISNPQLMTRLLFTHGFHFKSPWAEALCAVLIGLTKCVVGAMWDLHLSMAAGEDCRKRFEKPHCQKPEGGPCSHPWHPIRDGIDRFCAFHGSNYPGSTDGKTGRTICPATFAETGGATGNRLWGKYLCEGGIALCLVHEQTCSNSWHFKRRGCVLRYYFSFFNPLRADGILVSSVS